MPQRSPSMIDIPRCSLPNFLFGPSTNLPHSVSHPDKLYLIDAKRPERHFTRATFRLWCQRFALGLKNSTLFETGDRVLLFSPNNIFVPVVFLGTICAGGIFTGANASFTTREVAHQIRDSQASIILCAESHLNICVKAVTQLGVCLNRVFVFNDKTYDGKGDDFGKVRHWKHLVADATQEARLLAWPELIGPGEEQTTLALNYSSGTTGVAKGVEITHFNYVAHTLQVAHIQKSRVSFSAYNSRAVSLGFLPLYHAFGQTNLIAANFYLERPTYIMSKFDLTDMLRYIQRYRVTILPLVPPTAVALAKHPAVDKFDLTSLETLISGAAPLSREIADKVEKRLNSGRKIGYPRATLKQGWGMTECTCSFLSWGMNDIATDNAAGRPNPNCEAKIVDEQTGQEILDYGPCHTGELCVRGPNVMKGYWRKPEATVEAFTPEGWLKTGDIAYVSLTGYFFIVDRKKELIKVKGNQVAPAELETLLLQHDLITDAAVIGIPTTDGDEVPAAYIVKEPGARLCSEDVMQFVEANVASYKRLTGGVHFIESVPKNPSGKILRRQLKAAYSQSKAAKL